MRIDVKKFLFVGLEKERVLFFEKAQNLELIHFIQKSQKSKEIPLEISQINTALKILSKYPRLFQEDSASPIDAPDVAQKILQMQSFLQKTAEEIRHTKLEIARIQVFGDFSLQSIRQIEKESHRIIQFFSSKSRITGSLDLPDEVIFVGSEQGQDYFIAINKELKHYPKLTEMRFDHSLEELHEKEKSLQNSLQEIETELSLQTRFYTHLHRSLIHLLNTHDLSQAEQSAKIAAENTLFSIEGWVPENKIDQLKDLVEHLHIHVTEIAVEKEDMVPTYLENEGVRQLGEDLVQVYDTPSNTDKDPSLWVLASFMLFFAFIIGDGGYGLLFLAIALYIRYRHPPVKNSGKRLLNLATLLSVACIAWGVMTASFFGISFSADSPVRKLAATSWLVEKKIEYHISHRDDVCDFWIKKFPHLENVTTPDVFIHQAVNTSAGGTVSYELFNKFCDNVMLELALLIGVVHVICSLFRYIRRNWLAFGWILFTVGGYLYFPYYINATSMTHYVLGFDKQTAGDFGLYLMTAGLAIALVLAIVKYRFKGVFEVMTAIQIFSDVLSYLRLYALSLASAIFAATVNETAVSMNIVLATVLIILGHIINIVLGIQGGVINGLRLNFLEWYHYSFEGGGQMFKPLYKRTNL